MAPCAAAGWRRGASAAAARGIRAAWIRCRVRVLPCSHSNSHGYPAPHPVFHLRLLAAHAVGCLGEGAPAQACAAAVIDRRRADAGCAGPGKSDKSAALPRGAAAAPQARAADVPGATAPARKGETIVVRTDLLVAEIDTLGGTLKRLELLKQKEAKDSSKNLVLLGPEHHYEAQTGLTGDGGPNHRTLWSVQPGQHHAGRGRPDARSAARCAGQGRACGDQAVPLQARQLRDRHRARDPQYGLPAGVAVRLFPADPRRQVRRRRQRGGRDFRRPELQRLRGLFGGEEIPEGAADGHRQRQNRFHQAGERRLVRLRAALLRRRLGAGHRRDARIRDGEARGRNLRRPCADCGGHHRARQQRDGHGAALRGSAGAEPPGGSCSGFRSRGRLRLAHDHCLAAVLAVGKIPWPERQLGRGHHPADGAHQGASFSRCRRPATGRWRR